MFWQEKIKPKVILEQTKKRKFTVGYHHGKLKFLPYNYQLPPMTWSCLTVHWLLGSVSDNVPPIWNLISKEVKHINNGTRMRNMKTCFMSEYKRVAIERLCWKSKTDDWDYMNAINVWDNFQNDFNIKYIINNKNEKTSQKTV